MGIKIIFSISNTSISNTFDPSYSYFSWSDSDNVKFYISQISIKNNNNNSNNKICIFLMGKPYWII